MNVRKFKADNLFDGYRLHGQDKVLITDSHGKVLEIVNDTEAGEGIQEFSGILSPGLINCHCHLELSHLKNIIPPHTGLIDFLCSVVSKRGFDREIIQQQIIRAEKEMYDNGIVAVGDIGNTADTVEIKNKSKIWWQNFVEVLGFTDEKAEENISDYKNIVEKFKNSQRSTSPDEILTENIQRSGLVPHAPYSISPRTFQMINQLTNNQIISIHNQEHPAEDELYKTGGGDYLKLFKIFGIDKSPFPVTGYSSIRSYLPFFNNGQTIFLIHNTYMTEEDLVWANEYAVTNKLKLVFCLCVNANLYIENKVPPIEMLIKHNCHIVLGTDSYSSNWQLSIVKEIQAIREHFPHLQSEVILQWATLNGAKALQWDNEFGSFEIGKKPGIVIIEPGFNDSKRVL